MTGDHRALKPYSSPAGLRIPVGQALMHSVHRIQLAKKSLSSRLIGGLRRRLCEIVSPAERRKIGAESRAVVVAAKRLRLSRETGCWDEVTAGTGERYVKKLASTEQACVQVKH